MELLRFTNSGTEANLMALARACAHTGRRKVLVFKGGYHGGVLAFAGGGSPVNVPHDWIVARYNDLADVQQCVAPHRGELAAILAEPMLGSGGCIRGDPAFLHGLRTLADECGALLIFDEVMTLAAGLCVVAFFTSLAPFLFSRKQRSEAVVRLAAFMVLIAGLLSVIAIIRLTQENQ